MNSNCANALQAKYQIEGVSFEQLADGICVVKLENEQATASVSLYGGQVLSFKPKNAKEVLYVCKGAVYKVGKAIRGGIPVCAPWFGASSVAGFPAHGAVRIAQWSIVELSNKQVVLELKHSDLEARFADLKLDFKLTVTVEERLNVELETTNVGSAPYEFSAALHSYFAVEDITRTSIAGFEGTLFYDATNATRDAEQTAVTFSGETDRIYADGGRTAIIKDSGNGRQIHVEKSGSKSGVIWNPWQDKAKSLADFNDDEYLNMICVEAANARDDIRLLFPDSSHTLSTEIYVK